MRPTKILPSFSNDELPETSLKQQKQAMDFDLYVPKAAVQRAQFQELFRRGNMHKHIYKDACVTGRTCASVDIKEDVMFAGLKHREPLACVYGCVCTRVRQ